MYKALTKITIAEKSYEPGQVLGSMEEKTKNYLLSQRCIEEVTAPSKEQKGTADGV